MKIDPMVALEAHFASQDRKASSAYDQRLSSLLHEELKPIDFQPVVSSMRRTLPAAAMILLGALTPRISQRDVEALSSEIDRSHASSVRTELESPWKS